MKKLIIMLICLGNINLAAAEYDEFIPILIKPDAYTLLIAKDNKKGERINDREDSILLVEKYPEVDTPDGIYEDEVGDSIISKVYVRCDKNLFRFDKVIHFHQGELNTTDYDDKETLEKIYKKPIPTTLIALAIDRYCSRH